MPIPQPVDQVSAPITGHWGIELREQGHLMSLLLQLERDLKANNPTLTNSAEEIGANRLDRKNFLQERGGKVRDGTIEGFTRQFSLLLQTKDVQLKEGLLAAKGAAKVLLFPSRTTAEKWRSRAGFVEGDHR